MRAYVLTYHIVHVNLNDQWLPFNFPFYNCLFFMAVLGLGCYAGFSLVERELLFSCRAQASHDGGFSSCENGLTGHGDFGSCGTWAQ